MQRMDPRRQSGAAAHALQTLRERRTSRVIAPALGLRALQHRLVWLTSFLSLTLPGLAAIQTNLFVSPIGSGTAFSQAQPGNLFAARDVVRTLTPTMTGDIVVTLIGGTYQLTNSFQL